MFITEAASVPALQTAGSALPGNGDGFPRIRLDLRIRCLLRVCSDVAIRPGSVRYRAAADHGGCCTVQQAGMYGMHQSDRLLCTCTWPGFGGCGWNELSAGCSQGIRLSSRAWATASVRLAAPSLPRTWPTCFLTVSRVTTSSRAMA